LAKGESLLVVGSIAFDDLEMPAGPGAAAGEVKRYDDVLGGAATYSSIAASLLGPVRLVGIVGGDFDEAHLESLRARGVDTAGVERVSGKTFRWRGRYSADLASRTTLDTQLNVFADFRPKIPAAYRKTPFVLLGNIHPQLQVEVLDQVERPRLVAADTMNFWISGEPAALAKMMKRVDLLMINDEEVRELSGMQNIPKAAADVRKRGPKMLIVKRGEHGALLFDDHGVFYAPAYPLDEVNDPTGAGDTFAGGLMGYLARVGGEVSPLAMRRAMFFASALASFCVEDIGPRRLQTVGKAELGQRIEAFRKLVDYGGALDVDAPH
jgi:sugar/nucleoside kinase (ribokinase family)